MWPSWDKWQTILEYRAAQSLNKVINPELRNMSHNFYPLQHFFPFPALHNLPVKYMYMLWTKWMHTMNKMNTYCEQNEYILWTKWMHTLNKMNTYYEQNEYILWTRWIHTIILWTAKNLTATSFQRRFLHSQAHLQYTLQWVITTKNVLQSSVREDLKYYYEVGPADPITIFHILYHTVIIISL